MEFWRTGHLTMTCRAIYRKRGFMIQKKKKDKYNNGKDERSKLKRTFEGTTFASELEMRFYRDYLLPLKEQGVITKIIIQPSYVLQERYQKYGKTILPIKYVGDFEVYFNDGRIITYDPKGFASPEAILRRKIFDKVYPDKVLEWICWSACDGGWVSYDSLKKFRAKRKKERGE